MPDLSVVLVTPKGQAYPDTKIPGEFLPAQVIDDLVRAFGLPLFDVEYSLLWETQNRTLDNGNSLADAGVKNGDRIKLVPSKEIGELLKDPPLEAGGSERTVEVVVRLPNLNTTAKENLDRDTSVLELLRLLANKYPKLMIGIGNAPPETMNELFSMKLGRKLLAAETLRSANVPSGDTITVTQTGVAG